MGCIFSGQSVVQIDDQIMLIMHLEERNIIDSDWNADKTARHLDAELNEDQTDIGFKQISDQLSGRIGLRSRKRI